MAGHGHHGHHGHHGQQLKGLGALGSYENVLATFRKYDTNRDGKFSFQEIHKLMSDLNPGKWSEQHTNRLMEQLDRNRDYTIDIQEFVDYIFPRQSAMGGTAGMSDYEKTLEYFRQFDQNKNGSLDKAEFTKIMTALKPGQWTPAFTEKVWAVVDKDKSGEVESAELVAWLFGIPKERIKAAKDAKKGGAGGPLVVLKCISGGQGDHYVNQLERECKSRFKAKVGFDKQQNVGTTVSHISARAGEIVFWDAASMMAHRDNPFLHQNTANEFVMDLCNRHIPRLLASLGG